MYDEGGRRGERFDIELADDLASYVIGAASRLAYTDPGLGITRDGRRLVIVAQSSIAPDVARRRVMHALYREKILHDTVGLRLAMLQVLAQR